MVSTCVLVAVFTGIGIAAILSVIPTYTSTRDITPLGESLFYLKIFFNLFNKINKFLKLEYCIDNLHLNVTFNSTYPYGNFSSLAANTSYSLSEAVCTTFCLIKSKFKNFVFQFSVIEFYKIIKVMVYYHHVYYQIVHLLVM